MTTDQIDYGAFSWETAEELTAKVLARLAREVPGEVDSLKITLSGNFAHVTGQVHSEHAKSAAIRMVAAFLVNHEIKQDIEVAGFLQPATDDWFLDASWDDKGQAGQKQPSGKEPPSPKPIIRYPTVSTADELTAGQEVTIKVDLPAQRPDETARAITLAEAAPGWGEIEVMVQVSSSMFEDLGGDSQVTVYEDGTSKAASVTLRLKSDLKPGTDVLVDVAFIHQGRFRGAYSVNLGKLTEKTKSVLTLSGLELPFTDIPLAPTLTVQIIGEDRELTWIWNFAPGTSAPAIKTMARHTLSTSPAQYAAELVRDCPKMLPSDLKHQMGSIGDEIWKAAPREFQDTYQHLRDKIGANFPIQFALDQFHIPWELMRPSDGHHLFLSHPVGRRSLRRGDMPYRLPRGETYSFVPEYDGDATLPAARDEQAWLLTNLGARQGIAEKAEFLKILAGENMPKISLVHFAGHGAAANETANASLEMEDVPVQIRDVAHRDTKLGERDRSIVILNACETATTKASLSWVEGWAPMLTDYGFGAVVAPLWRVQDSAACNLVIAGLEGLYSRGETIGQAFSSARLAGASESSAAFAFLVYGDVMAKIES